MLSTIKDTMTFNYVGYDYLNFSALSLMIVLGFGLYLITIKKCGWSTLIYTLLIYAFSIQLYLIWRSIWNKAFLDENKTKNNYV